MSADNVWSAFYLSLQLAILTTLILFLLALPVTYGLYFFKFKGKSFVKAVITLPLVLPPTVLGYYILLVIKEGTWMGDLWSILTNQSLAFSFEGILLGSVIYSLPFMINPIYSGLEQLSEELALSAFTLGQSRWQTFRKILLPNVKSSILTAIAMTFAHTVGEFGVILMIGGSIKGETKVASIAVYEALEALDFELANKYAILLLVFSMLILLAVYRLKKRIGL